MQLHANISLSCRSQSILILRPICSDKCYYFVLLLLLTYCIEWICVCVCAANVVFSSRLHFNYLILLIAVHEGTMGKYSSVKSLETLEYD